MVINRASIRQGDCNVNAVGSVLASCSFRAAKTFLRRVLDLSAQIIEASLRAAFPTGSSNIALEVLANYLAYVQIAFMLWWLWKRQRYTPEHFAQTFHRLQRAAIRDAFGLPDT